MLAFFLPGENPRDLSGTTDAAPRRETWGRGSRNGKAQQRDTTQTMLRRAPLTVYAQRAVALNKETPLSPLLFLR